MGSFLYFLLVSTYILSMYYISSFIKEKGKDEKWKNTLNKGYFLGYSILIIGISISYLIIKLPFISIGYEQAFYLILIFLWISGICNAVYIFYKDKKYIQNY